MTPPHRRPHVLAFVARHRVTLLVALLVALASSGTATAVTYTFVKIAGADGTVAKVAKSGALQVESRAGIAHRAFNAHTVASSFAWTPLVEAAAPDRLAITEMTLADHPTLSSTAEYPFVAEFASYVVPSGAACSSPGAAPKTTHRRVTVRLRETVQLTFPGPALYPPAAAAGKKTCFGFRVLMMSVERTLEVGATGYRFQP